MAKKIVNRMIHPAILLSILLGIAAGISIRPARAAGWSCPVPSVSVGSCGCSASGCKKASSAGDWVCDYAVSGGSSCSCPPLEMCDATGLFE